jgi:uncharacterized damage-inducible protein DinB
MPRERWFDRRFELGMPLTLLPGVVERLRGTPARLEERLRDVPAPELTRRVAGTWSIQENTGHLLDLEPLWLTRVQELVAGRTELTPADLANRRTHEADHNEAPLPHLLERFRRERGRLVEAIEGADEAAQARQALHPRLQAPMRLIDLAFFVAEHDDHHLARITELLRRPG